MYINKNIEKVSSIVSKQISFLHTSKSNQFFFNNRYQYGIDTKKDHVWISLLIGENSAFEDDEDHEYPINIDKVKNPIRFIVSVIVPKMKKSDLNKITNHIVSEMSTKEHKEHDYYGNYDKNKIYSISLSTIYSVIDSYMTHKNSL